MVWNLHCLYDSSGSCTPGCLTMVYAEDGRFTTLAPADPVIWASGRLLRELHQGCPDFVTLKCGPPLMDIWAGDVMIGTAAGSSVMPGSPHLFPSCRFAGDVITITGDDCRFIYVVRRRVHFDPEVWELSWPD